MVISWAAPIRCGSLHRTKIHIWPPTYGVISVPACEAACSNCVIVNVP